MLCFVCYSDDHETEGHFEPFTEQELEEMANKNGSTVQNMPLHPFE